MSRRFWIVALLAVLGLGAILALSIARANDGADGFSTNEVTGPPPNAAPRTP